MVSYKEDRLGEMVGEFEECLVGLWEERENCKGKGNNKVEVKKNGVNGVNNGNVNNIVGGVRGYAGNNGQQGMNVNALNINNNNYNSNRQQPNQGISRQLQQQQPTNSNNPSKPY